MEIIAFDGESMKTITYRTNVALESCLYESRSSYLL